MTTLSRFQMAAIKRTAQNVKPKNILSNVFIFQSKKVSLILNGGHFMFFRNLNRNIFFFKFF